MRSGILISTIGAWLGVTTAVLMASAAAAPPNTRAVLLMGASLVILWCGLGGLVMRRMREPCRAFVQGIRLPWQVKFVAFATFLALVEETLVIRYLELDASLFHFSWR